MESHAEKEVDLLKRLGTNRQGLTSEKAAALLATHGLNEITQKKRISAWKIFFNQFNNFLVYILVAASGVSIVLGFAQHDTDSFVDAGTILAIVVLNSILGFIQEYKAESSLEALRKMITQKANVLRDGRLTQIDAKGLVPGDIIVLEAGDKVPADGRILDQIGLKLLEASLTGESTAVGKKPGVLPEKTQLADRTNMVFSGTSAVAGKATVVVTSTAMHTELGMIAHLISDAKEQDTPLQKKLEHLGKYLGIGILGICIVVFIIGALREGFSQLFPMFLLGVSLAVAAVPEGLPAIITIALALGMQRMIKRNALIRKLHSVEALGSTTVICSDKTGTLTKNEMTVRALYIDEQTITIEGAGYDPTPTANIKNTLTLKIGALCNNAELYEKDGTWKIQGDPTEAALLTSAHKAGLDVTSLRMKAKRVHEILFDSERKRMTTVHKEGSTLCAYTKGAPTIVLEHCTKILSKGKVRTITAADKKKIIEANDELSSKALRILAFAYRDVTKLKDLDKAESELIFAGLQGMIDPPRAEVKGAIELCRKAGIKVVMITGDYIGTAQAIAKELGLTGRAVTGEQLDKLDLNAEVEDITIYARVNPEHKTHIVQALKKHGHIVAMTGDGVNDAPALKNADIGIAMGITGTDVAKEASAMVLTDDNFTSIVGAVEEGRGIYDNIRKFVVFLMGGNVSEVAILFIALLIGFKDGLGQIAIPLLAIHLLWINLVTDGIPALALGVDPYDSKIMGRKPRKPNEPIISKDLLALILTIGAIQTTAALILFSIGLGEGVSKAQTLVLSMVVVSELLLNAMVIRRYFGVPFFSNKWFLLAALSSIALHLTIMYTPLHKMFKITQLGLNDWTLVLGILAAFGVLLYLLAYLIKRIALRRETASIKTFFNQSQTTKQ